jgi:ABC-type antimicrobial peptide transport system permease subunit
MPLLAGFAGLALVLAALGIYGVLSYSVAQRTRELAVRAALGAQRRQLLGLVVRGLRVVDIGAAAGVVAGIALTRTMSAVLVDVTPNDPGPMRARWRCWDSSRWPRFSFRLYEPPASIQTSRCRRTQRASS